MDNFYSSQEDSTESTSEEEGNEENQFYRWANFWKGRLANSENIFKNAGQASALMAEAIYDYDFCEIPDDDAVVWEKLGPSNSDGDTENNQGRIKSMSVHPTNPDIIVVGAEQGGIWKTVDGGANWYNTTDQNGLSIVGAKQIVRHPLEPNYMYAATGNAEGIGFLAIEGRDYGMGVLVSIDGGENWERTFDISLDDGRESLIGDIAVSPLSTIEEVTIYAASSHRIIKYVGSPLPNINAPFDEQWQVIHSDSEYYEEPGVTGTNGTGNIKVESDGTVWFTDRFDLYKIEPGASTAQSMLLTPPCENTDSLQRRTDFHVSINDNDELAVFASYYYNDAVCTNLINASVCDPDNEGEFVSVVYNKESIENPNYYPRFYLCDMRARADNGDIALSKSNDDVIYIEKKRNYGSGGRRPQVCTGFGEVSLSQERFLCLTCTANVVNTMHVDVRNLQVYSSTSGQPENDVVYNGHDGGISKSEDGGMTWENIDGEGLLLTNNLGMAITPQDRNYILIGAQDNSINLFTGDSWVHTGIGGDNAGCAINPKDKLRRYQSSQNSLFPGAGGSGSRFFPVLLNPNNFEEIFWGDRGHVNSRSLQGGPIIDLSFPTDYENSEANSITMPLDNNLLFAAVGDEGRGAILKFERTSTGWTNGADISMGIKAPDSYDLGGEEGLHGPIIDIDVDPDNPLRLWATIGGFNPRNWFNARLQAGKSGSKVFQTEDGGVTWTNISGCLPNVPILSIVYQRGTNDRLYIGTDLGVFVKKDASTDEWAYYAEGGPRLMIHNMEINHCSNELVVATQGQGLWRVPLLETTGDAPPREITGSNVIWKDEKSLISDLVIKNGAKLTIKDGRLSMKSGTKIFIEKGGKLYLDNGTISNYCGDRWQGIIVEGDAEEFQFVGYQGYVNMRNGSLIENAETAVTLFNPDAGEASDVAATTGGMIWATDSEFRNNLKDVWFGAHVNDCPFNSGICDK